MGKGMQELCIRGEVGEGTGTSFPGACNDWRSRSTEDQALVLQQGRSTTHSCYCGLLAVKAEGSGDGLH